MDETCQKVRGWLAELIIAGRDVPQEALCLIHVHGEKCKECTNTAPKLGEMHITLCRILGLDPLP